MLIVNLKSTNSYAQGNSPHIVHQQIYPVNTLFVTISSPFNVPAWLTTIPWLHFKSAL